MRDQADELRQLVRRAALPALAAAPAPLVVVGGGKGGVGTTTIAVQLAAALVTQGRRTVLVDADLDRAGATLGGDPDGGTLADVLAGRRSVHEVLARGPAGIQCVSGAWAPGQIAEPSTAAIERLLRELSGLGLFADVVVIDVGNARNAVVRQFWQAANLVLLVTHADPAAIMEAYAAIKLLAAESQVPIHALVNQTADAAAADEARQRIARACQRFLGRSIVAAGQVPPEPDLAAVGRPIVVHSPRCEAARALERLAESVWNAVAPQRASRAAAPDARRRAA